MVDAVVTEDTEVESKPRVITAETRARYANEVAAFRQWMTDERVAFEDRRRVEAIYTRESTEFALANFMWVEIMKAKPTTPSDLAFRVVDNR